MGKNKRKRSHTKHVFVQKKYRDALFRRIFNEKSVLLELYNALNQTDYDTYGHVFGDEVLVAFGQILEKYLPDNGIAVRFGGEEFMLILPDTTEDDIRRLLQSMRSEYKQFIKMKKNAMYSFSSGVAQYQTGMEISGGYG